MLTSLCVGVVDVTVGGLLMLPGSAAVVVNVVVNVVVEPGRFADLVASKDRRADPQVGRGPHAIREPLQDPRAARGPSQRPQKASVRLDRTF